MLFNSLTFMIFLPIVFGLYWFVCQRNLRLQNLLVVVASYIFYGWLDCRLLGLLFFVTLWTYLMGVLEDRRIRTNSLPGKGVLALSVAVNLSILLYFKYANFFLDSLSGAFACLGAKVDFPTLNLLFPIGISFYVFQAVGYSVDVFSRKTSPIRDPFVFFAFLGFFPQLLAGPIARSTSLIPQFQRPRHFDCDSALHGICLIVYGLFKKMVVADTLTLYVDSVFASPTFYCSTTCLLAAFFFTVQIYCDFSGYSDCARGIARLFGFELMLNFDRPYLARTFADFWRRWHISLSSWFRDYVYIPLGGNRVSFMKLLRNTWIVFLLSGLWHGASWTFVGWGALHALYISLGLVKRRVFGTVSPVPPRVPFGAHVYSLGSTCLVFASVAFAWIFFRVSSFSNLSEFLGQMITGGFKGSMMQICAGQGPMTFLFSWMAILLLMISYGIPRDCCFEKRRSKVAFILVGIVAIVFLSVPVGGEFIYFQF